MSPTLSLALIVRDEAANLPLLFAGLKVLQPLQIMVMDTGSRDGTKEMARSLGAEVRDFAWNDDFAAARNAALEHCRGDFILWLDADDRLPEASALGIPDLLAQGGAWRLVVHSPRQDGTGDAFRQIRIFPNHRGIAFEGRIHEQLVPSCIRQGIPIRNSDLEILHVGYATPEIRGAKAQRNLNLLRHEAVNHPRDPAVAMALANALFQTGDAGEAKNLLESFIANLPAREIPAHPHLRRFPCLVSECHESLGQSEDAEGWDSLAMEWEPAHFLPFFRQAKRELRRGGGDEALRIFLAIVSKPVVVDLLASDNASVRRNALGYAALLDTQRRGAAKAEDAKRCLLALMQEGLDPLPVDSLFPFEFFRDRGEMDKATDFAKAWLKKHPEDEKLKAAFLGSPSPPNPLSQRFGTIAAPLRIAHAPGLTVAMIVKNEAKNIRAAVESLRPIADEIVVNDTGSTDGTQALLAELGVRWFQTQWQNDFSQARNQALEKATRCWILWMDADDRLPEDQIENFRKLKSAPLDRAFGFQVINTQGGLPLGGRFMQVRMFPNHPALRFRYRVHEQIVHAVADLGLHCFYTETAIHHTGYEDPELKKKKARRNLEILSKEKERLASEPTLAMSVGDSHFILGQWEEGIEAYKRAFEIPDCRAINADIYAELPACIGRGFQHQGRFGEALRWYERSRELDPDKVEPAYYQAECLLEMGAKAEAEKAFGRVSEMPLKFSATTTQFDTIRIFSLWHQARLLADRGANGKAIEILRNLNQAYPQVLESWHLLGKLLRDRGDKEEAALCFSKGVTLNPKALESLHRDRLELLREMGRKEEFEAARELAQESFPSFTPPPEGLATMSSPLSPYEGRGGMTHAHAVGGGVKEQKSPLLSLCLIVKNEMANLPACLESAEGLADEVVVVDTGSTDGTPEWAERRGAKVLRKAWENDFSAARNHSLEAAKGRWILWLDADDRLLPADKNAIRALVVQGSLGEQPNKAYGFMVMNTGDGGQTGSVFNQIRLFPNRRDLRFSAPVHEQILPALEKAGIQVEYSSIRILHTGYADPAAARAKQIRNRGILEEQIRNDRDVTPVSLYTLGMACLDLGDPEIALQHFAASAVLALDTATNPHIVAIAPVKSAVALAQMQRYPEAIDSLDIADASTPIGDLPESALVRAQVLQAMGREDEARAAYEKLLAYRERPTFTPVDFPLLKIQALRFLGQYWHSRGQPDLGLQLLKAGLAVKDGVDFNLEDLRKTYSDLTSALTKPASV